MPLQPMEVEEVGCMEEVTTTGSELEIAVEGATGGTTDAKDEEALEEAPIIISDKPQQWHSAVPQVNNVSFKLQGTC